MAILREEADARHNAHKDHASSRPLSDNYELVGLLGESKFGEICNQMPDLKRRLEGDSGIDFVVPLKFSVDVKTARNAFNLIHEQGKKFADIYVLASFKDSEEDAELLGWEWGAVLKNAPVKDFGYGIMNHYIPADKLKPISELQERMVTTWTTTSHFLNSTE
jgi:hypothetical protein